MKISKLCMRLHVIASCRLKLKMIDGENVTKITVKSLMLNPVVKAVNKFSIQCGFRSDDLIFKSKGNILSGEELAGSIDKGRIEV